MADPQQGDLTKIDNGAARVLFGGVDFGFTMEGIEAEYTPTWNTLAVDQYGPETDADLMLAGQRFAVTMRIPEFVFSRLKELFPGSINSISGPDEVLTVGRSAGARGSDFAKELVLHPIKLDASDFSKDLTIHKAMVNEGPSFEYQPAEALMREITFVAILDDSKSEGNKLFSIGVKTVGVDTTAPAVSARNITDTDVGVVITTNMDWTMDEDMDPATIISDNVMMLKDGTDETAGAVSYDAPTKKITFNPTSSLDALTPYTAVLGTGVKDVAGNKLAAKDVVNFTTA